MPLFSGIQYSMIDIDRSLSEEIKHLLEENGAREIPIIPENRINLDGCTHIISSHIDFLDFEEAARRNIVVVTPEWVRVSSAKKTCQSAKMYSPDPKMIFSGLTVSCSEIPPGDRDAIYGGIIALGGQFTENLTRSVTHIFALNDKSEKCQQAMSKPDLRIKIVLPHWFDMCLKLRRRIDPAPYLFPDPPIFKFMEDSDKAMTPATGGEKYTHPVDIERPPPKPAQLSFEGKRFLFGSDLKLGDRVINTLKAVIMNVGGLVVEMLQDATVYIGAYREGEEYVKASRKNLVVGNLTWLYWMCANDQWISPLKYLLHYPLVPKGIPGMQDFVITVTNYTGEARIYLEKLIQACGARYTRNMKPENTHLIAANESGEKYKVAKDWNINIVNHVWLEESYAAWTVRAVTDTQFTTFPHQSNLMQIINSTSIYPESLLQFYEEETEESDGHDEEFGKIPDSTAPNGSAKDSTPKVNAIKISPRKKSKKSNALGRLSTPISDPQGEISSSGKRRAASAAQARLSETIMPDMNAFEKERKRKTMADPPEAIRSKPSKGSNVSYNGQVVCLVNGNKRARLTEVNEKGSVRLMHTGYEDSTGKTLRALESLGVKIVEELDECTHLAAPGVLRTEKFLKTFPFVDFLVSTRWIEACVSSKTIIGKQDPLKYPLLDPEGEAKYQCSLVESRARAEKNGPTLFKDYTVVATNSIKGGIAPLCRIVSSNGGRALSVSSLKTKGNNFENTKPILITTFNEEKKYKDKFLKAAQKEGKSGVMYTSEWILCSVLRQEIIDGSEYTIS